MKLFEFKAPINRLGFVIFVIALLMVVFSWCSTFRNDYSGPAVDSFQAMLFSPYGYVTRKIFRWGVVLLIAGAFLAWAYEPTIGRVIRWIRSGN